MSPARSAHRKLASLGLGAVLLGVLALGLIAPLAASITEARDAIAADEERLQALRAKRVDLAQLESELKTTRARTAAAPLFTEAPTSAAAWERLEAILRDLASKHEAAIGSTRVLRIEDERGLKAMRADIELVVSRAQLTPLILAMERNAPQIFFDKLRLTSGDENDGDSGVRLTGAVRMLAAIGAPGAPSAPGTRR